MALRDLFRSRKASAPEPPSNFPPPSPATLAAPQPTLKFGRVVEAVGESYYDEGFAAVCGEQSLPIATLAALVPEPQNQYDSGAVAVVIDGHKCGHLSRDDARTFRRDIDAAIKRTGAAVVAAQIVGAPGRYGIYLEPADVLPFGRQAVEAALIEAGFENYDTDPDGFGITNEPNGSFAVWNGGDNGETATDMGKALRDRGFAARVGNRSGGGKCVRVTGWK